MAIEAELKARVHDPEGVLAALEAAYGPGRGRCTATPTTTTRPGC
ncbi:hypothetical protein ACFQ2M_10765 [Kitasatospora saccharophila]